MITKIKFQLHLWKKWTKDLFRYPKLELSDDNYDKYWQYRNLSFGTQLNSFQQFRLEYSLGHIEERSSVIDVGGGSGSILAKINKVRHLESAIVADFSGKALEVAKSNGLTVINTNISQVSELDRLPECDYVCIFEVLEHIPNSEEVLLWAVSKAKKGVLISFPNSGFFVHRLRLLLGRFPLQWRIKPSEHMRFWTLKDTTWWLGELKLTNYSISTYEGPSILRKVWPGMFSQGIIIFIPTN